MSGITRTYHGCQIVSTPADYSGHTDKDGNVVVDCDGWDHAVRYDDRLIGEASTLADAIRIAKAYTPPADELTGDGEDTELHITTSDAVEADADMGDDE